MVNIVIKTLKNQKLDLEVQDDDTIEEIKKKINEQHKLGPPEAQKLIHRGKILQNQSTVKEIGFKEKDFVVVMVKKAKPKVKTNKTSTQQTTETTTTSNTNTSNTSNTNTSSNNNNNTSTTTNTSNTSNNNNSNNENVKKILDETNNILTVTEMITGPENVDRCIKMLQEKVNEIISPRKVTEDDCRIALRAAFNFPQRAGNILLDEEQLNIEKVKFQQTRSQPPPQQQQQSNTGNTGNPLPTGNPTGNPLQGLGGGNQLLNLIGQLARTNPDLMRAIQNDPQALQRALQDPQLIQQLMSVMILQRMQQEQQGGNQQGQQQGQQQGGLNLGGQQQRQQPNQPGVIRISQEDQEKIKQVMEFTGCQHRDAAEAFFACDKSVELAVNYVLTEQSNSRLQFQQPTTTTTTTTTTSTTQPQQQQQQEQPKNDDEKPKEDTGDKN